MNMKTKQGKGKENNGTINLILAAGLIFFCILFLGGIKMERNGGAGLKTSDKVVFATQTVAGTTAGTRQEWQDVAARHPDLMIRSTSAESHE